MSAKSDILSQLFRSELPDQPTAFSTVLTNVQEALGMTRMDAERFAAAYTARYWANVLTQVDEDKRLGVVPFCDIVSRNDRILRNSSAAAFASGKHGDRRVGILLRARPRILTAIDALTDRQFEAVGCAAARLVGAQRDHLTPKGSDGGIDFFANIRVHSGCHLFTGLGREVRIVAQCKKFESRVEATKVEAFFTTLDYVRKVSDRVRRAIPPWFHAGQGPVVGWIIAHSGFQSGSIGEARRHGVILSDSRDLAEIFSLSRNFFPLLSPSQRAAQIHDRATSILAEYGTK